MLSRKIDLTENFDFSGGTNWPILIRDWGDSLIPFEVYDNEAISLDQYHIIEQWEGMFGKRHHWTQKHEIFDCYINRFINDEHHCKRCGKEFRIPWKRIYDLCPECNEAISVEKIPWILDNLFGNDDDKGYNLFNLR